MIIDVTSGKDRRGPPRWDATRGTHGSDGLTGLVTLPVGVVPA